MVESTLTAENFFTAANVSRGDLFGVRREVWTTPQSYKAFRTRTDELAAAVDRMRDPAKKRDESFRLGCALWVLARYEEAAAALEEVKSRKEASWIMGMCLLAAQRPQAAREALERACGGGEPDLDLALDLAAATRDAESPQAALKLLRKHRKAGENSAAYHYETARCLELLGDSEEAEKEYLRAFEIDPECAQAAFRLGYLHDLYGNDDQAKEYYQRCLEAEPKHANALLNLGVLYEDTGELDKARECFTEVLKADPTHPRARLFLRDVLEAEVEFYEEPKERPAPPPPAVLDLPVADFELSVRCRNCLEKMNIRTLGDLTRITERELLAYKNFGDTSLEEIRAILAQHGLRLGQGLEGGAAPSSEPAEPEDKSEVLATPVKELDFSARARKCMERLEVETLGELIEYSRRDLLQCPNLGRTSVKEIEDVLAQFGLALREDDAT